MMAASHHPIVQGRTPPPIRHRHRLGEFLLCVDASCRDASLYLLIGIGILLLQMWCPHPQLLSSCKGSSWLGRGSLAWERELDSWEGALVAFKNGLVTFECALGRACMERYAECTHAEAVR
jgi:hypothetical protein